MKEQFLQEYQVYILTYLIPDYDKMIFEMVGEYQKMINTVDIEHEFDLDYWVKTMIRSKIHKYLS